MYIRGITSHYCSEHGWVTYSKGNKCLPVKNCEDASAKLHTSVYFTLEVPERNIYLSYVMLIGNLDGENSSLIVEVQSNTCIVPVISDERDCNVEAT
jgi:hypothetical protein